jgi:hypothetical protein
MAVLTTKRHLVGGKEKVRLLPDGIPVETVPSSRAGKPGYKAALKVPLEIEGDVIVSRIKFLPDRSNLPPGADGEESVPPGAGVHYEQLTDERIALKDFPVPLLHHPVDFNAGRHLVKKVQDRQGVDNVSERGNLDDEDPHVTPPDRRPMKGEAAV